MKAEDRNCIQREILQKYPGTDPEMDIDWDIVEISFKAGIREVVEFITKSALPCVVYMGDAKYIKLVEGLERKWQEKLKDWFKDNPELLKEWGIEQ